MVYVTKSDRPFVYGDFVFGSPRSRIPPPPGSQPFAIEILREYSVNEFIGKLYVKTPIGNWQPASLPGVSGHKWYMNYAKLPRLLYFDMEGSGRWAVEHF